MANTAAFIAGGLLTGIGNAGMQFALEDLRAQRDLMLRKVDQEYRSGEADKERAFRSEESLATDTRRADREDQRDQRRADREAGHLAGAPVMDSEGNLTGFTKTGEKVDLGVKGDTSASEERRARADWYKSGRGGPGGRSGGTEFERLSTKLAEMDDDDPMRPMVEDRLHALTKGMSDDQRKSAAALRAQADARNSTAVGDKRDKYQEERLRHWERFYGVKGAAAAPEPPPKEEPKPSFFERNNPFGSSAPKAAPPAQAPAAPAAQAPQIAPAVNVLPAPRDPAQRKVGQTYTNPAGRKAIWTGQGWQPVE